MVRLPESPRGESGPYVLSFPDSGTPTWAKLQPWNVQVVGQHCPGGGRDWGVAGGEWGTPSLFVG